MTHPSLSNSSSSSSDISPLSPPETHSKGVKPSCTAAKRCLESSRSFDAASSTTLGGRHYFSAMTRSDQSFRRNLGLNQRSQPRERSGEAMGLSMPTRINAVTSSRAPSH
jgi:hypothetical protein